MTYIIAAFASGILTGAGAVAWLATQESRTLRPYSPTLWERIKWRIRT